MQNTTQKIAYLTIDDSPSAHFIPKLEYLKSKNIPAIFFCIGQLLEKYPDAAIKSIQLGYPIENHSYSHPHFSDLSLEDCRVEIEKTDQIIEHLYQQASVKRGQKMFRFPYGDKGDLRYGVFRKTWRYNQKRHEAIQQMLGDLGYAQPQYEGIHYRFMDKANLWEDKDMSWSFDIMEWASFQKKPPLNISSAEKVLNRLVQQNPRDCRGRFWFEKRWLSSSSAEIILLHDHVETDELFFKIIDQLEKLPLKFSSVW